MTEQFKQLYANWYEARQALDSLSLVTTHGKSIAELAQMHYQYKQAEQWVYSTKQALDCYKIGDSNAK